MTNAIGSLIALVVFLLAAATAAGLVAGGKFLWWVIAFLALAVLLGWSGWSRLGGGPRA